MKQKIILIFIISILIFCLFLIGCKDENRIEELENRIIELQEELSAKEGTITELQQQSNRLEKEIEESISEEESIEENSEGTKKDSLNDESIIVEIISDYINAVEREDFDGQRRYVAKYALDLVNMKEFEHKHAFGAESRTIDREEPRIDSVNGNKAEGYISFTEHLKGFDGSTYDLITEGKVHLEKINGDWKIIDYTRKNHLISEALFMFEESKKSHKDIAVSIDWVLFSLFDEYVNLHITITNDTDIKLGTNVYSSTIIGPDRLQNEMIGLMGELGEIFPNAIAIGDISYNWTNASAGDLILYFGDIYREDNYNDVINDLTFEIDLSQAVRY